MNIGTEKTSGIKVINYLVWFRFNKAYLPREKFVEIVKGVGLDENTIPRLPKKPQVIRQLLRGIFSGKEIMIDGRMNKIAIYETGRDPMLVFHISGTAIDQYKRDYTTQKICTITYDVMKDEMNTKNEDGSKEGNDAVLKMTKLVNENTEILIANITNKQIADYVTYYLV